MKLFKHFSLVIALCLFAQSPLGAMKHGLIEPVIPLDVLVLIMQNLELKDLLKLNQVCTTLQPAVQVALDHVPYQVPLSTQHLKKLKSFVKRGSHFIQAAKAAQKDLVSSGWMLRCQVLIILKELVLKGYAIDHATSAAQQGIVYRHPGVREQAEKLLQALAVYHDITKRAADWENHCIIS